jgi:hypothetical protein
MGWKRSGAGELAYQQLAGSLHPGLAGVGQEYMGLYTAQRGRPHFSWSPFRFIIVGEAYLQEASARLLSIVED